MPYDGILLLGWMEHDEALHWLQKDCSFDPALNKEQAEETWQKYKKRVDALPDRKIEPPKRVPIPGAYQERIDRFLKKLRIPGSDVLDIIRINPRSLLIYQLYVNVDRSNEHARDDRNWIKKFLPVDRVISPLPMKIEDGVIKFTLPHGEHIFGIRPEGIRIEQGLGIVCVAEINGRMFLKGGYHRSFAFSNETANALDANDKCEFVALTRSLPPQLLPDFPNQGLRTTVLGSRPPLFSDFFDADLAMSVKLRKKRYEAHMSIIAVDDE